MNYIEQINLLSQTRRRYFLEPTEIALYVILLDYCNRDDWNNPIRLKNTAIQSDLGISFKLLAAARNRLQQTGLIQFKTKNGSPVCIYTLHNPAQCARVRTSAFKAEVQDEVWDEVRDEVKARVQDKVQAQVRDEVTATNTKGIINQTKPKQNQTKKLFAEGKPPLFSKKVDTENTVTAQQQTTKTDVAPAAEDPLLPLAQQSAEGKALYYHLLKIYTGWFKAKYNLQPKMDALQARALKELIAYFREQVPGQVNGVQLTPAQVNERVAAAFKTLLDNWALLDEFYQGQTKLSQIASNIQNLIVKLKNPTHVTQKQQAQPGYVPLWRR
jgi:hypothetical protein